MSNEGDDSVAVACTTTQTFVIKASSIGDGICLLRAAQQQIPRAMTPRSGMTILWGLSNPTTALRMTKRREPISYRHYSV